MRADMSKVLVDEPRRGRAYARAIAGSRRLERNRVDRDGEAAPVRLGMKNGQASKWFGEHLGPLYRYLRQQVDRPWAKVYGELCAALDKRSVVQAHLFEHIRDKVDVEAVWQDGAVWLRQWRGLVPLSEGRAEMYVHPRTGILLVNRARVIARRRTKEARAREVVERTAHRRSGSWLPPDTQWHRVDGLWYEIKLRRLDAADGDVPVFDVVLRRTVTSANGKLLKERYGASSVYACAKRQLDGKTLRQHGLACE